MKKIIKYFLILVAVLTLTVSSVEAAVKKDNGSNAADFLRFGVGAAPTGQGEAFVARSGVVEAMFYNPAGLMGMKSNVVQFQHNQYLLDIKSEYLAYAHPLKRSAIGASLFILDEGDFVRRTISNPNGAGNFSAKSWVASVAIAKTLFKNYFVGLAIRHFSERIDDASRSGIAFDVGIHGTMSFSKEMEFGVVVKNIGKDIGFDKDEESLPLELRAGVSFPELFRRTRVSLEMNRVRHQEVEFRGGLEYGLKQWPISLRAGYDSVNDLGHGYTLGAGFKLKSSQIDYSFVPYGIAGDAHRFSLNFKF